MAVKKRNGEHGFVIGKYYVKEINKQLKIDRDVEIGIHWSSRDDIVKLLMSTDAESIKTLYSNEVTNAIQNRT